MRETETSRTDHKEKWKGKAIQTSKNLGRPSNAPDRRTKDLPQGLVDACRNVQGPMGKQITL